MRPQDFVPLIQDALDGLMTCEAYDRRGNTVTADFEDGWTITITVDGSWLEPEEEES